MPRISYSNYIILRNYVKQTNYERINTGRRSAQTKQPPTAMTAQELDTAYQYRQRAKREKLLRLADVNFEAVCTSNVAGRAWIPVSATMWNSLDAIFMVLLRCFFIFIDDI